MYVAQRLCGSVSDRERPAAVVQKGVLTATAAPDGGPTSSATPVVVHARDGAGLAVSGLTVLVDASPVGVTGTPFAWLPSSAGTHPGTVVGRDRYHDASFTLTATTPPKPPSWSLTLNLAYPAGVEIGTFAWHCTPQGGAPIAGTGAPATIALPATAAAPTVTVVVDALSVTMLLDGARYPVVWSTFQQTTVVVFTKPTMTLGLWVEWTGYFDQAGNAICRLAFAGIE